MSELNIDTLVEQAWYDLNKETPKSQVRKVVVELAVKYSDSKVNLFLPIIIHRETVKQLSTNLTMKTYEW